MTSIDEFKKHLENLELAANSITAYLFAVRDFHSRFDKLNKRNLMLYKVHLIDGFRPKTVNLRIMGLNKYVDFLGKKRLRLKLIKEQQKSYLENVISNADYTFLKNKLREDRLWDWYFVVRFLAATGARVSELVQLKAEHVHMGFYDIYSKGGKSRRLYIPKSLRDEATAWLTDKGISSGFLFVNSKGQRLSTRRIAQKLKSLAALYCINPKVVYPHSFRHLFAKNFLSAFNDLALLADLMGHESIETTRIYLRKTATEQQEIVDKVIDW